jgi:hypothetical protein
MYCTYCIQHSVSCGVRAPSVSWRIRAVLFRTHRQIGTIITFRILRGCTMSHSAYLTCKRTFSFCIPTASEFALFHSVCLASMPNRSGARRMRMFTESLRGPQYGYYLKRNEVWAGPLHRAVGALFPEGDRDPPPYWQAGGGDLQPLFREKSVFLERNHSH